MVSRQKSVKQLVFKFGTEDYREVLGEIQRVGQNFSGTLQGAQDRLNALKQARAVLVRDDADNLVAIKRIDKEIAASGQQAANALANSYRKLGFESEASLRAQIVTARSAYDAIEKSGVASARDIAIAYRLMNKEIDLLTNKLLGKTTVELSATAKAANFLKTTVSGLAAGIVGLGIGIAGLKLAEFASDTVAVGSAFQGVQARLNFATGSQASGETALNQIRAFANPLGQDIQALATNYAGLRIRLKDANTTAEDQLALFKNLTITATALKLETGTYSGALNQLLQGLGSGVVRGGEYNSVIEAGLISQSALAQALGTTTDKVKGLVDQGKLTVPVLLEAARITAEKLTPAAIEAGKQFEGASNRAGNAVKELQVTIFNSGLSSSLTGILDGFTGITKAVDDNIKKIKEAQKAYEGASGFFAGVGAAFGGFSQSDPSIPRFPLVPGALDRPRTLPPTSGLQKSPPITSIIRPPDFANFSPIKQLQGIAGIPNLPPVPPGGGAQSFAAGIIAERKKLLEDLKTASSPEEITRIRSRLKEIKDQLNPLPGQLRETTKAAREATKAEKEFREAVGELFEGIFKESFATEKAERDGIFGLGESLGQSPEFKKLIEDEKKIKDQLEGLGATFSEPFGGKAGGIFNVTSDRSFAPTPLLNSGVDRASPGGLGSPTDVGSANNLFQSIVDDSKKAQDALEETQKKGLQLSNSLGGVFENGFANAFTGFITGAQTAGQAFQNFAGSVVSGLAQIAAQQFAKSIFSGIAAPGSFLGGLFGVPNPEVPSVGSFSGFADFGSIFGTGKRAGGLIDAPGNSTSDSILTPTSSGEFVFPANRVREIGIAELERARAGFATRGSNSNQQGDVNFYVTTPDANSFRASKSQLEFDQLQQLRANARRNS